MLYCQLVASFKHLALVQHHCKMLAKSIVRRGYSPQCLRTRFRSLKVRCCAAQRPGVVLRKATSDDAHQLAQIDNVCAKQGSAGWSDGIFASTISNDSARVIVAESACKDSAACIVGFIAGVAIVDELQVENFAVLPDCRGQGIGKLLLSRLLEEVMCDQCTSYLEVKAKNEPAVALYMKLGFEKAGLRKKFYPDGSDALIMTRPPGPLHNTI